MVNLINLELAQATNTGLKKDSAVINYAKDPEARKLLANPLIFIRKWIGEVSKIETVWENVILYKMVLCLQNTVSLCM